MVIKPLTILEFSSKYISEANAVIAWGHGGGLHVVRDESSFAGIISHCAGSVTIQSLKVPKREIFDRSNFPDSWVCDLVVKISTYYFNF